MDFAKDEEEAAAAARAAHERREERILQQSMAMQTDKEEPEAPVEVQPEPAPADEEVMDVDDEDVDPLDAFMANLDDSGSGRGPTSFKKANGTKEPEPETYFSDDDYGFEADGADPKSILAILPPSGRRRISLLSTTASWILTLFAKISGSSLTS